jgi:hypothetical protein
MVSPNAQDVVNGKLIIVTLLPGHLASITVGMPGNPRPGGSVSIKELLDAGLTEHEALSRVLEIAKFTVRAATV